jgi:aspartate-semialdehyde dehydrogenase
MLQSDWVLLGGDTLLEREIRDLVEERKLPVTLRLGGAPGGERVLRLDDEDGTVVEPLTPELLSECTVMMVDGAPEPCREALAMAHGMPVRPAIIDLNGIFEDLPECVVRAPLWESPSRPVDPPGAIHSLAHPAALALARLVEAFHEAGTVKRVVATVFEPASEHGRAGVDELHSQTLSLFNFQPLPQTLFDTQASFTLLPRFGPDAKVDLQRSQRRLERHLATLVGERNLTLPSVRLLHAPVFHGHTMNVWVEFERHAGAGALRAALAAHDLELGADDMPPASNFSVAGQSGLSLSDLVEDHANPRSVWLWAAFDNARARAEAAVVTAGMLTRGRGKA